MWKLAIEDDQANKTVVNLVRDEYTVGRSEDNTVRLTERNISRRHAKLHKNGAGWVLEDLASYNGCFVNGVRVSEPQNLEHGDLVQVGDYRLEIVDEQVAAGSFKSTVPSVPKAHSLVSQPDRLVQLAGPTPGAEFALVQPRVVIGRGEECDISVNHASVSRVHAEIHALGDGRYEVVDRESANGIRVNGVDLKRSLIDARDTVELGDVVMKFIPAGQVFNPASETLAPAAAMGPTTLDRSTPSTGVERRATVGGIPPVFKLVAGFAAVGVAIMLGMVAFGGKGRETEATVQPVDSATQVLQTAMELLKNGEVEAAHVKVTSEIPEDSNARQSTEFKDIEARWADMLFDMASREQDPTRHRAILDRIAKATSVDSGRRKRALVEMSNLDQGLDVQDLPSAPKPIPSGAQEVTPKPASTLKNGIVVNDPFKESGKPKAAKPAVKPKATSEPGPNINDSATSGDRQKATAAKNALKAKINSGKGTDADARMLRALCRQLGDMSCVN